MVAQIEDNSASSKPKGPLLMRAATPIYLSRLRRNTYKTHTARTHHLHITLVISGAQLFDPLLLRAGKEKSHEAFEVGADLHGRRPALVIADEFGSKNRLRIILLAARQIICAWPGTR